MWRSSYEALHIVVWRPSYEALHIDVWWSSLKTLHWRPSLKTLQWRPSLVALPVTSDQGRPLFRVPWVLFVMYTSFQNFPRTFLERSLCEVLHNQSFCISCFLLFVCSFCNHCTRYNFINPNNKNNYIFINPCLFFFILFSLCYINII